MINPNPGGSIAPGGRPNGPSAGPTVSPTPGGRPNGPGMINPNPNGPNVPGGRPNGPSAINPNPNGHDVPGGRPNGPGMINPNPSGVTPGGRPNGHDGPGTNGPHPTRPDNGPGMGNGGRPFGPGGAGMNGPHPGVIHNPEIHTLPSKGSFERNTRDGGAVRFRPNGGVSDVHDPRRGMDIHHGLNGGRRVIEIRPDHSRRFFEPGRPGFVEHQFRFRDHDFERRTYIYHGRSYDHFYHPYRYHGLDIHIYAPSHYYHRDYYGWAYNPWREPIHYRWGWWDSPWRHHYGYYFNPYPVYPSAAFWLTDYLIAANLQAAYAAQMEGGEVNGDASMGAAPLNPDVKQQIADEVRNQLALETQQAQNPDMAPNATGIAGTINDVANGHPHVFVVGTSLDVVDYEGLECSLSDGDVLQLRNAPPLDATAASLVVLASKGGRECARSDSVQVSLDDLQEMQNQMQQTMDQGLQELRDNQGKGGLPMAPISAQVQPAAYMTMAPPPDQNAASDLQEESQQFDQVQNDATSAITQEGGAAATAPTITAGQTIVTVESILGQPSSKAILGNKVIYNYSGMKVTFINGRVANVE